MMNTKRAKALTLASVTAAVCFLLCPPAFSAVGIQEDGVTVGIATDLKFAGSPGAMDGSTYSFTLLAVGIDDDGSTSINAATANISDAGFTLIYKDINAGTQAGTLANGSTDGHILTIKAAADSGGTWNLTPTTKTGFTTLVFNDAGDSATLLYVNSTVGWVVLAVNSVTVN